MLQSARTTGTMEEATQALQGIQVPNPDALKFAVDRILSSFPVEITFEQGSKHLPVADELFDSGWVERVFVSQNFITVIRKKDSPQWSEMYRLVRDIVEKHILSMKELVPDGSLHPIEEAVPDGEDGKKLAAMLTEKILPATRGDGGEIRFDRYEDGVLYVRLSGACDGCPYVSETLSKGIEVLAKREFPELKGVTSANRE